MIIRTQNNSLQLITQPDHAALAARMMERWTANGLPENPRRKEILLAVRAHDNGWREVDQSPMVDPVTGQLQDFLNVPVETKHGIWPRGVESLSEVPYAAALVAQHALHIHDRLRSDAQWVPFFAAMEGARDRYLARAAPHSLSDLLHDYAFIRLGDLLSLAFCNAWTNAQTDEFGYTAQLEGTTLTVTPDPLNKQSVPLEITVRELPNHTFSSPSEASAAFESATSGVIRGVLAGKSL